jgi:hypothetical protein
LHSVKQSAQQPGTVTSAPLVRLETQRQQLEGVNVLGTAV